MSIIERLRQPEKEKAEEKKKEEEEEEQRRNADERWVQEQVRLSSEVPTAKKTIAQRLAEAKIESDKRNKKPQEKKPRTHDLER